MSLHLILLGSFEVRRAGVAIHDFRTQTARLLLAYLAIEADRPHEREHLASLSWPDAPSVHALAHLRPARHAPARAAPASRPRSAQCAPAPPPPAPGPGAGRRRGHGPADLPPDRAAQPH